MSDPFVQDMLSDHILYVDRSAVREGHLDDLKEAMTDLIDFVKDNEPDILSYAVYFSPDGELMTVVHSHDGSASLEHHMKVAGPKFPPIGKHIDMEAIDVYGSPSDEIVEQLREKASTLGQGQVTIHEFHGSIDHISV